MQTYGFAICLVRYIDAKENPRENLEKLKERHHTKNLETDAHMVSLLERALHLLFGQ